MRILSRARNRCTAPKQQNKRGIQPWLVPIGSVKEELVVCALANVLKDNCPAPWTSTAERREFVEQDIQTRLHCAESSLGSRYQERPIIRNARFLADICIPIQFEDHPKFGRCVVVDLFDAAHGAGAARRAVEHLLNTGSVDTRHLRDNSPYVDQESVLPTVRSHHASGIGASMQTHTTATHVDYLCSNLGAGEFIRLLYALLVTKASGQTYELSQIDPITPHAAYDLVPAILRQYGETEPTDAMVALAITAETGIRVETLGENCRVYGLPHSVQGELNCLVDSYLQRCRITRSWWISILGTFWNLPAKMLLVLLALEVDMPLVESVEQHAFPLLISWFGTLAAPFNLGRMVLARARA